MKKSIYVFLLSSGLIITATLTAYTQPGSLDLTFGTGGKVTTDVGDFDDFASSIAIQNDGKIVVVGGSYNGIGNDFSLVRYNTDGSLDKSFDNDGIVITNFGLYNTSIGSSVAIQKDGKIVVAGYSFIGIAVDFTLARYNIDGTLDTSFDTDGILTTDIGSYTDIANAIIIMDDDKIVVAGSCSKLTDDDFALIRYNSDGSLDSMFDSDGKVTTDFEGNEDIGVSMAVQGDGKIVVAGSSSKCCYYLVSDIALVRYNMDGSLDSTFDLDGKITTDFDSLFDSASSVVIQSDGKILVVGSSQNLSHTQSDFVLARYNSDGSLDSTFDSDGKVRTDFDSLYEYPAAVAIQGDGKIVVVGSREFSSYSQIDFVLARYNSDGSLDDSFDSDGKVITSIGSYYSAASSVVIQADDKIVVSGRSKNINEHFTEFALARYNTGTVGVAEKNSDENKLSILPNPFNNELVINGTKENAEILIFDGLGNEIMRQKTRDEETKINTESLLPGFYFLNFREDNKMMSAKLVKL